MNFNPYSRSHLGNPFPVYTALREERPVHLNDRPRFWAVSRHEDIDAILRDWNTYISGAGITLDGFTGIKPMIILMDPPRQTELRRVMQHAFAKSKTASSESIIRSTAIDLLDAIGDEDQVDLVSSFCSSPDHRDLRVARSRLG
jgi:cytochrome P450